jgi:hypothetical protein
MADVVVVQAAAVLVDAAPPAVDVVMKMSAAVVGKRVGPS